MIPNEEEEGQHYLAVIKLSTLKGITSNHHGDFYCFTCLHSFRTENILFMMTYIIYADIEFLINKRDRCTNNPENSSTGKIGEHILCGYSMSTTWAFYHIENT